MAVVNELLRSGSTATKREIYYQNEGMFANQAEFDRALDRLARTLQVPRDDLGIVAGSKGMLFGPIQLQGEDSNVESVRGIPVNARIASMKGCRFVLIVEKEAIFQRIIDDYSFLQEQLGDFVLITGKGYPCMATRALVAEIGRYDTTNILVLVDLDPYGLEIALQYKIGSAHLAQDECRLACPRLEYFGATFNDIDCYGNPEYARCPLSKVELGRLEKIKGKAEEIGWSELKNSAINMIDMRVKTEIEAIGQSAKFFTRNYLLERLSSYLA